MKNGRIPLLVGVTGHRDLRDEDLPQLRKIVSGILAGLKASYPSSPIILLSSLAEGADRLVAHAAVDMGMSLIVPLPMAEAEYRKDFATEASQKIFSDLLTHAEMVFVSTGLPEVQPEPSQANDRSWLYARAGHFIVKQCHVLLALWDGNPAEKTGGTSQIVRLKREGLPYQHRAAWADLDPPETGTVFHIVTPRQANPNPPGAFEVRKSYADISGVEESNQAKAGAQFLASLARTDAFNRDVEFLRAKHETEFQASLSYIEPETGTGCFDPNFKRLLAQFAAADALAVYYQRWRFLSLGWLCFLVVPIAFFLGGYHFAGTEYMHNLGAVLQPWSLGFFLGFVGVGWIVHAVARSGAYESRHLDYRALAEGLRVLYFWRLGGLHDDPCAHYLRKHWSEIDWIRLAIRAGDPGPRSGMEQAQADRSVLKHWVIDQREFFHRAERRDTSRSESHRIWASGLVVSALVLAAVMLAIHLVYAFLRTSVPLGLHLWLHFAGLGVVVLLASAGAVAAFAEKLAYAQLAKQYGQMYHLFAHAAVKYEESLNRADPREAGAILARLGHDALRENGEWLLLHRERPMEIKLG